MPPSSPTFAEEKVPSRASMADKTRLTITLKSTKYQYSLRLDLPENTAYFLSASKYQPIRKPPRRPRSHQLRRYRGLLGADLLSTACRALQRPQRPLGVRAHGAALAAPEAPGPPTIPHGHHLDGQ